MVYGYCRVSTRTQNIERQVRNILGKYPNAVLYKECYTGTKIEGRVEFEKLKKRVKSGDTIVFDSVSRMSRNVDDGIQVYFELLERNVDLEFLVEPHISTTTYKKAISDKIALTNTDVDILLEAVNRYLRTLAKEQIRLAFEQSEKEVKDIQNRTKQGIQTAKDNGKQIGAVKGKKLCVKKAITAKAFIKARNKDFGGDLNDVETYTLAKISKPTFYKYKAEIIAEV